jgi:hypothetical protein
MDEKEPPEIIDLDETEWTYTGKKEPILGPNGLHFLIMFVLAFPIAYGTSALCEYVIFPLLGWR